MINKRHNWSLNTFLKHFLKKNSILIAQGEPNSITSASLLMQYMCKYQMLQLELWYSKRLCRWPLLCAYPPIFYPASAQYLAYIVVSISRRLLVMRRPLPILGTIVANKYRVGVLEKLLSLRNDTLKSRMPFPFQGLNACFSNLIWKYNSHNFLAFKVNIDAMNLAICFGFQIWYSLLPSFLLTLNPYDINQILSPDIFKDIHKQLCHIWNKNIIHEYIIHNGMQDKMREAGITFESGVSSTSWDPLGIIAAEEREVAHKDLLKTLLICSLALCILSSVTYAGIDLCQEFRES